MMLYTMKQACAETGLTYDTLKFYCNEGLVPNVKRDQNNRRVFDEKDIAWVKSLTCLKRCSMSTSEVRDYIKLCQIGTHTIPERQKMLDEKLICLQQEIQDLQDSIDFIHYKQQFYRDVLDGKCEYYSNLR